MDIMHFLRALAALAFILGLIWVCAWALRRYGESARSLLPSAKQPKRLGIIETTAIDARRKLVLIRRDNVEHLLLMDMNSSQVIETGIAGDRPNTLRAVEVRP